MFPQELQELQYFYTQSNKFPVIPCQDNYSTYRINSSTRNLQEILQLQGSSRACLVSTSTSIFQWLFPVHPSILHGRIRLQAPTAQAGFQLILPGRNSIKSSSQHPCSPYSSSQVHSYRILPGEIGFIQKGQVLYIYAILRSVCSNLLIRIILQEYLFYPEF